MNCPQFIARCFALRTAAHYAHLSSKSFAEHIALDEFYSGLLDLTDKYAEVYMGLYQQVRAFPEVALPSGSPAEMLAEFLEHIKDEIDEDKDYQSLLNILAEIEELTARTLYKLRYLK